MKFNINITDAIRMFICRIIALIYKMVERLDPEKEDDVRASSACHTWAHETNMDEFIDDECCPTCGGDGFAHYIDCPEAWGEDCPILINHLIICPNCNGTGLAKDATCF